MKNINYKLLLTLGKVMIHSMIFYALFSTPLLFESGGYFIYLTINIIVLLSSYLLTFITCLIIYKVGGNRVVANYRISLSVPIIIVGLLTLLPYLYYIYLRPSLHIPWVILLIPFITNVANVIAVLSNRKDFSNIAQAISSPKL